MLRGRSSGGSLMNSRPRSMHRGGIVKSTPRKMALGGYGMSSGRSLVGPLSPQGKISYEDVHGTCPENCDPYGDDGCWCPDNEEGDRHCCFPTPDCDTNCCANPCPAA